ncbi:hypothetical protein NA56DRAFT_750195 [Hyaloscypha hepaticicola]|uniref:2EXR domain-containing protein n=1 Tax=Hyaloscypha hepaticicola TaxID=2082293 RepID=A0A2J6Q0X9_9HELO|nr:hypothetical protein NA56DRAFT_750195 [Hyaloscypha hepaticicola]
MATYQFLPLNHHLPPFEKPTPGFFKLFPNLPLELRRKIWLFAVPQPPIFKLLERNEDDKELGWTCMTEEERQTPAASPTALRPAVYVNFAIDVFILIPRKNCTTSTVNRIPSLKSFNFPSDVVFRIQHYHTSCEVGKGAGGFPWRTNSFLGHAMLNEGSLQDIKFRFLQSSKEFAADPSILPGII